MFNNLKESENCKNCENCKKLEKLQENVSNLQERLDYIVNLLENNVIKNCNKMGNHIDFVENIYDHVKNPLGYLCHKINSLIYDKNDYSFDDKKKINFDNQDSNNT